MKTGGFPILKFMNISFLILSVILLAFSFVLSVSWIFNNKMIYLFFAFVFAFLSFVSTIAVAIL